MNMKKLLFAFPLGLLLLLGQAVSAAEKNAMDYLPEDNFKAGWIGTGSEVMASPRTITSMFRNDRLLLDFDPVSYASETYTNLEDHLNIEITEFATPSDAWGYYQMSPIPVSDLAPSAGVVIAPYALMVPYMFDTIREIGNSYLDGYKGNFYFKMYIEGGDDQSTILDIAQNLLTRFPGETSPAGMISLLPGNTIVGGTEKYFHGNTALMTLTGLDGDHISCFKDNKWEAVAAEYRLSSGIYYLLTVIDFKKPRIAEKAVVTLQDYYQDQNWTTVVTPAMKNGSHPRGFSDGSFRAFWSDGNNLWLIHDADNRDQLLGAIEQNDL